MAEATALRNNALPYPIYGVTYTIVYPFRDADGDLVTGASTPDAEISKNGDTFADCTNESTEIATSSGIYYLTLTATEMTADVVAVIAKSATAGMKTAAAVLYPRKLPTVRTGTSASGGVATSSVVLDSSASAVDDYYNGCVVAVDIDGTIQVRMITDYTGSSKTCTVVPDFTVAPDNNDTFTVYQPEGRPYSQADVFAFGGTAGTFSSGRAEVNTTHIAGSAVSTSSAQIGVNVVNAGGTAWASGSLTSGVFATGAITATAIAADAIGASELAADAVAEIADAVWDEDATAHQTQGTFGQAIGDPAADTNTIYKAVVTDATGATVGVDVAAVLADTGTDGVVVASIANGAITAAAIATDAIDADAIADNAINAAAIADGAITAAKIATDAIDADALADGAITAATFAAGAIDATAIAANAIGASELAADAATEVAAAVWDKLIEDHKTVGTFGGAIRGNMLEHRTIGATGNDSTHVHLAGLTYGDDEINDYLLVIYDVSEDEYHSRFITDYVSATDLATVDTLPFTPEASTDLFWLLPVKSAAAGSLTAGQVADAVWDEARADHTTAGTFGQGAASVQGNVTGNVGGNVTGSVGSVATGGIAAASFAAGAVDAAAIADGAIDAATFASGAITATAIAADAIGASELAADAVTEIQSGLATAAALATVDDFLDTEIADIKAKTDLIPGTMDGKTFAELILLMAAVLLGKASGLATTTAVYRSVDDTLDRVTATVDGDGNRSAVSYDTSSP